VVLAVVSLVAAACELADESVAAASFLDFLDFFLVVVSVLALLSLELVWAATIDGANANINAQQRTADNKANLFDEFIFLALQWVRGSLPRICETIA